MIIFQGVFCQRCWGERKKDLASYHQYGLNLDMDQKTSACHRGHPLLYCAKFGRLLREKCLHSVESLSYSIVKARVPRATVKKQWHHFAPVGSLTPEPHCYFVGAGLAS